SVHASNSPGAVGDTLAILREGDIFCHAFHGEGPTLLDKDNIVLAEVRAARDRGVLFEVAHGSRQFSMEVARACIEQDFLPDIISSDLSMLSMFRPPAFSLAHIMSKFLHLGMSIED